MEMDIDEAVRAAQRTQELASELLAKDPSLGHITAYIIAGDLLSAERAEALLAGGMAYDLALAHVGSFARLDFALRQQEAGHATREHLLDILPEVWRGSDPDDTDLRFLRLWEEAFRRNGGKTIRDGRPLPAGRLLTVYRGQDEDAPFGWAWSLSEDIARKFARGAGLRQSHRPGVIWRARVPRGRVMAYLTQRNEQEVIVSPHDLRDM